jgi:hypothetical protein
MTRESQIKIKDKRLRVEHACTSFEDSICNAGAHPISEGQ